MFIIDSTKCTTFQIIAVKIICLLKNVINYLNKAPNNKNRTVCNLIVYTALTFYCFLNVSYFYTSRSTVLSFLPSKNFLTGQYFPKC